jgi:hypothetical protein
MCNSGEDETVDHLFFNCSFARQCWAHIGIAWETNLNLEERFLQAKASSGHIFFIEAVMIAAWELWKVRNDKVFNMHEPSRTRWLDDFKVQGYLQSVRFGADLRSAFCFWLDAFS